MAPAKGLATELPVLLDRLSLVVAQIALHQPLEVAPVAAAEVVVAGVKVVTVRTIGGGTLTVPDQTIRMNRGSTNLNLAEAGFSYPASARFSSISKGYENEY